MKIRVEQKSEDPSNSILVVYANSGRQIALIYEDDFVNHVLTNRQNDLFLKDCNLFDVDKNKLQDYSKKWFSENE